MARLASLLAFLGLLLPMVLAQAQPALPLSSSSRWILDANGQRVKFRCVNWPGHMEANIPEGLHRQSMDYLVDWIKRQGFNCVRLTYSIDMALNPGMKVSDSFTKAAADAGVSVDAMKGLYAKIIEKNPWIANATTRDVFGALIDKLWYVSLLSPYEIQLTDPQGGGHRDYARQPHVESYVVLQYRRRQWLVG